MTDTIKTSRRALLAGVPAVAVLAAGTTVNGLAARLATPSSSDPIFEAIERHKAVCNAARAVGDAYGDLPSDDPNCDAGCERFREALKGERKVLVELLTCKPTTFAGCVAVLGHVGRPDWMFGDDSEDTILSDAHEREIEEAEMFLGHLAAALRDIVAGGQA
jgi:hypothetical protein